MRQLLCGEARSNMTTAQAIAYMPTLPVPKTCPAYP
jgi:hypothetical protein